jgi:hypothetical protein
MPRPEGPRHSLRSGSRSDSLRGLVIPAVLKCTIAPGKGRKGTRARARFSSALLSPSPSSSLLPLPGSAPPGPMEAAQAGTFLPVNPGPVAFSSIDNTQCRPEHRHISAVYKKAETKKQHLVMSVLSSIINPRTGDRRARTLIHSHSTAAIDIVMSLAAM